MNNLRSIENALMNFVTLLLHQNPWGGLQVWTELIRSFILSNNSTFSVASSAALSAFCHINFCLWVPAIRGRRSPRLNYSLLRLNILRNGKHSNNNQKLRTFIAFAGWGLKNKAGSSTATMSLWVLSLTTAGHVASHYIFQWNSLIYFPG